MHGCGQRPYKYKKRGKKENKWKVDEGEQVEQGEQEEDRTNRRRTSRPYK